jgi:anti-sigma factor RsiW
MSERNQHPRPEELLQSALGELSAGEEARIQAHLANCPECRTQAAEFSATDREFTAYYRSEYVNTIPPPPHAWQGFANALHQQASARTTLSERCKTYLAACLRTPRLAHAALWACVALVAIVAVVRVSRTPVVSASEILRRAVATESDSFRKVSHAAVYQKLRVRVGHTTLTRVVFRDVERHRQVDRWTATDEVAAPAAPAPDLSSEFQAARLDWDDPLSPGAIHGWLADRERHAQARQEVREVGDTFTVSSSEANAPVTEARFVVRSNDFHPVSALYRFQDQPNEVEFTELAYEVRRLETLDASVRSELASGPDAQAPVLASGGVPPSAGSGGAAPSLESLEINALYALHQHHADLGGETEVTRNAGAVKVAGVVESGERKAELRSALAHLPDLQVELYTAQEAADRQARVIASAPDSSTAQVAGVPVLREALAARFPDQASRDTYVLGVLDCSQQALAHGFALHRLASLYPAATAAALTPEARSEIRTMSSDHLKALRKELDSLFERLTPLAGEIQSVPAPGSSPGPGQAEPASFVPDLQRLDRIVSRLVSSDGADADAGALLREYHEIAGRLRQDLARL